MSIENSGPRIAFGVNLQLRHCGETIAALLREHRVPVDADAYVELDMMLLCLVERSFSASRLSRSEQEIALKEVIRAYISFGKQISLASGAAGVALRLIPDMVGQRIFATEFRKAKEVYSAFLQSPERRRMLGEASEWLAFLLCFLARLKNAGSVNEMGLAAILEDNVISGVERAIESFLESLRGAQIEFWLCNDDPLLPR